MRNVRIPESSRWLSTWRCVLLQPETNVNVSSVISMPSNTKPCGPSVVRKTLLHLITDRNFSVQNFKYLKPPLPSNKKVQFTTINLSIDDKNQVFHTKNNLKQLAQSERYILVCRLFSACQRRRYRTHRCPTLHRFHSPPRDLSPASSTLQKIHQRYVTDNTYEKLLSRNS